MPEPLSQHESNALAVVLLNVYRSLEQLPERPDIPEIRAIRSSLLHLQGLLITELAEVMDQQR
jgi:hypothetical protein